MGRIVFEHVVGPVFKPAKREHRAISAAFGRVIKDHIQNDFDPGAVEGFDHVAELIHRAERVLARTVGGVWGKKRERTITPVVFQTRLGILFIELENRQ